MSLNTIFQSGVHKIESEGAVTANPPDMRITRLAFKNRMQPAERIAVRAAGNSDPIIFDFMDLVSDAQFIDLSRQDTINGVNYLGSQGHLTLERANEILTNPITDEERP